MTSLNTPPNPSDQDAQARQTPSLRWTETMRSIPDEDTSGYEEVIDQSQRRLLIYVPIVSLTLWVISLFWGANTAQYHRQSWGGDSYSRSALGHRALLELLKESEWRTSVSRYHSAHQDDAATIVSLAPREIADHVFSDSQYEEESSKDEGRLKNKSLGMLFNRRLSEEQRLILALPKRKAVTPTSDREGTAKRWIKDHTMVSLNHATRVLKRAVYVASSLQEEENRGDFRVDRPQQLTGCQEMTRSGARRPIEIKLTNPQVIVGSGIRALVACDEGVLIGSFDEPKSASILLISDSDLVANFNLSRHAETLLDHFERFAPRERLLLIDETAHGHRRSFSISEALFTYPLYPFTLQVILVISCLIYFAMSRLTPPKPKVYHRAKGKRALIEGIAVLLQSRGYSASACRRYVEHSTAQVARELKLSTALNERELIKQLDQIAAQRKLSHKLRISHIYTQLTHAEGLQKFRAERARLGVAMLAYRWKKEMIS